MYQVRTALQNVRNPAITVGEIQRAFEKHGKKELELSDSERNRVVYVARWGRVNEALENLDVELQEAQILWGDSAKDIPTDLFKCRNELFLALRRFIEDRESEKENDLIYGGWDNDEYSTKLNKAIENVENYLRQHLK